MSKESRDRRAYERRYNRIVAGTASSEDFALDALSFNRARLRHSHRYWEGSKRSLLMNDFQYMNYCVRDWVPQLLHKGRKP